MKSVFIAYSKALTEPMMQIIDKQGIRGFTQWEDIKGRGSFRGEPHYGTHTWPSTNSAIIAIVADDKVEPLFKALRELDDRTEQQGLRAFVWSVEGSL
ncbi:MAG: hypothetical protein RSB93_06675 [Rikenellaceae bacterium]